MDNGKAAHDHKRVVAYIRVSTDDKDQRPERQEIVLKEWAARSGVEVTAWIVDEGTSARKVEPLQRQKVLEAIRAAQRTKATALVVENLDRWCRTGNRSLAATDFRMEHEHGLDVVMVDMPVGLEGMAYEIIRTVKAEYAREFSDLLGRRIRQGLALARKNGFPNGVPGRPAKPPMTAAELDLTAQLLEVGQGGRSVALAISKHRGAFDVADAKIQRQRTVRETWVKRQVLTWCNKNPDQRVRFAAYWPALFQRNVDEKTREADA